MLFVVVVVVVVADVVVVVAVVVVVVVDASGAICLCLSCQTCLTLRQSWGGVGWGGVKFLHIERKIIGVVHSHPPALPLHTYTRAWLII